MDAVRLAWLIPAFPLAEEEHVGAGSDAGPEALLEPEA